MKHTSRKAGKLLLVSAAAFFTFALVVLACTRIPGSAQTAFADSLEVKPIPEESISLLEGMQQANRAVASAVLPAVVTLDVVETKTVPSTPLEGFPWFFFRGPGGEDDNGENEKPRQREYRAEGLGSGVIVRKTGNTYYLFTNQHVVGTASEIKVKLFDEREFTGKLVGGDERKDIALVSFESDDADIPVAVLGDSDTVSTGDIVFAFGAPLGYMSSVTQGIVSAVGRSGGPNNNINDFIQTDAAINRGNSGGPLVNIYGEVIGINSWIASSTGGSQGLGFSIPVNNVRKSIDDFIKTGKIHYGWLGVSLVSANQELLEEIGIDETRGALASQIFIGSPAEKGGMVPGDFVVSLNGREVRTVDQLVRDVGDLESGETAVFEVIRQGKKKKITVRIEERKEGLVADASKLWPGFIPIPLTEDILKELKLDNDLKGVLVHGVQAKSPAAVMGLQNGDVVTAVNDKAVKNIGEFYRYIADSSVKEVWFDVLREGQTVSTMRYKK